MPRFSSSRRSASCSSALSSCVAASSCQLERARDAGLLRGFEQLTDLLDDEESLDVDGGHQGRGESKLFYVRTVHRFCPAWMPVSAGSGVVGASA